LSTDNFISDSATTTGIVGSHLACRDKGFIGCSSLTKILINITIGVRIKTSSEGNSSSISSGINTERNESSNSSSSTTWFGDCKFGSKVVTSGNGVGGMLLLE